MRSAGWRRATPVSRHTWIPTACRRPTVRRSTSKSTPLGTRGGIAVRHFFPADGEYAFRMSFYHYSGKFFGALQDREQIEVSVDGRRVALLDVNLRMTATDELRTPPIKIAAGARLVSAAFIARAQGPVQDFVMPFETALNNLAAEVPGVTGLLHLTTLGISGPTNVTGPGDTPSRRKIFVCRPASLQEEEPCARRILAPIARGAFRRPVDAADFDHLMRLFQKARQEQGGFEDGVRAALQGILADPNFVYRFERPPSGVRSGSSYRVSDLELASRLSYFLVEQRSRRDAHRSRQPGKIEGPCGSGTAGPPHARRRPVGGVGEELCVAVAAPPESSRPAPGPVCISRRRPESDEVDGA